jgi:uncharacterized membrane protein
VHLVILWSDVKCCVYVFFTSSKIENICKTNFIFLFTTGIFSTDVKPLLISNICTSDGWSITCFDEITSIGKYLLVLFVSLYMYDMLSCVC